MYRKRYLSSAKPVFGYEGQINIILKAENEKKSDKLFQRRFSVRTFKKKRNRKKREGTEKGETERD